MPNKPIDVTDDDFDSTVLEAQKPVVVDFWAEWCPPCKTVDIWMQNLVETYGDRLLVAKVEADRNPGTIAACEVRGLPTILFYHQGRLLHRQIDELGEVDLRQLVDDFLAQVKV